MMFSANLDSPKCMNIGYVCNGRSDLIKINNHQFLYYLYDKLSNSL